MSNAVVGNTVYNFFILHKFYTSSHSSVTWLPEDDTIVSKHVGVSIY